FADARRTPLSPEIPPVMFGSMANDGGHLFISADEHAQLLDDPIVAKYLRPFVGARELIHGTARWCLWLADAEPSDIARSAFLRQRVEAARAHRAASARAATR